MKEVTWAANKIEQWETSRLIPYARNARTHSEAQIGQIAASIKEFGFTNPILAGSDGVIVAGHGRLAAAQKLGLDVVPVLVLDHLTKTQRRALVIADNRIAEAAAWDIEMLGLEIEGLEEEGFDFSDLWNDADECAEISPIDGGYEMAPEEPQFVTMTLSLHRDDAEGIRRAIALAAKGLSESDTKIESAALTMICAQWVEYRGRR